MNPNDITGDMPDFITAMKLTDLALEQFSTEWCQPTKMDESALAVILQMHQCGLLDMAFALEKGKQIVLYRLAQHD